MNTRGSLKRFERVYFIRPVGQAGPIKIGYSEAPDDRLRELQTWSPVRLEIAAQIPGDKHIEEKIQDCFAHSHSHGEWFHPTDDLVLAVKRLASGEPLGAVIDLRAPTISLRGLLRAARKSAKAAPPPAKAGSETPAAA